MPTFAEKLHEVRKARDFTQDQLAKEMNVSRQTISHWENGRAVPDIDTIRHLSQVLDHNFLAVEETRPVPEAEGMTEETQPAPEAAEISAQPEEESAQEKPVQQTESAPRKRRFILPAVLGIVLLCAVVVVCLMMNGKPSGAQAQVSIVPMENPVHAIHWEDYPDGVGWLYEFRIEETAGIPFTVHQLDSIIINDNGGEGTHSFNGEDVAQWWGSDTLVQNSPQSFGGGFPLQDVKGVRIVLSGTDANGKELTFEGSLELLKEIAE